MLSEKAVMPPIIGISPFRLAGAEALADTNIVLREHGWDAKNYYDITLPKKWMNDHDFVAWIAEHDWSEMPAFPVPTATNVIRLLVGYSVQD